MSRNKPLPPITNSAARRFWGKVGIGKRDECWLWKGCTDGKYGKFSVKHEEYKAARVAYYLSTGTDPAELDVCHSCDNPPCCNPQHLSTDTRSENLKQIKARGRRTWQMPRGEEATASKLTEDDVWTIRKKYATGIVTQRELAVEFDVARSLVSRIVKGKIWPTVTKGQPVVVAARGWKLKFARIADAIKWHSGAELRRGEKWGFIVRYVMCDFVMEQKFLSLENVARVWCPSLVGTSKDGQH